MDARFQQQMVDARRKLCDQCGGFRMAGEGRLAHLANVAQASMHLAERDLNAYLSAVGEQREQEREA